jgi:hypothetical protein
MEHEDAAAKAETGRKLAARLVRRALSPEAGRMTGGPTSLPVTLDVRATITRGRAA